VVTEDANGINVDYSSTHFGHGSNLGRCRLTADERSMIAGNRLKNTPAVEAERKILHIHNTNDHTYYSRCQIN